VTNIIKKVNVEFKKNNLEWMAKFSGISLFIGIGEFMFTHNRVGYFAYFNPNYLGSIMMMSAIINLYFTFTFAYEDLKK